MANHLTAEQIVSFRNRTCSGAQWEIAFEHAEHCTACNEALFTRTERDQAADELISTLRDAYSVVRHLEFEDLWAHSIGNYAGRDQQMIRRHLEICSQCRSDAHEVQAQRTASAHPIGARTKSERAWRIWVPTLSSVASIAVVVLIVWNVRGGHRTTAQLSLEEQRVVESALATGRLDVPPEIRDVIGKEGVLLGPNSKQDRPVLARPLGTAVSSQTPQFEWSGVAG
jgi:hypothetical protein